ncbi:hypothetical protein [Deinococcus aestuarii]|uniref:hypothetical protein n=1 Tax=Deinococcus aestuarii TaxID=2774531 RepID=UPI001C0D3AC3|nr:hypothetical protein [Deinococcus aestuarii]
MHVMMFRATIRGEHLSDIEGAVRTLFAAIQAQQPQGVRYASSRLGDSSTYVILLALDQPGENPLASIPEFRAFQEQIQGWLAEPTVPQPLTVVGSYNLF